jgi:hypothetical protein
VRLGVKRLAKAAFNPSSLAFGGGHMGNYKNEIEERDLKLVEQPYFYVFIPQVAVPAGATAIVTNTVSDRDFIWTDIGWTTDAVFVPVFWLPAVGVPFRVNIWDIHGQKMFSNERVDLTTITGGNPQWFDKPMFRLIRPWRFVFNTSIRVEFLNDGPVPAIPRLTLGGYLTDSLAR